MRPPHLPGSRGRSANMVRVLFPPASRWRWLHSCAGRQADTMIRCMKPIISTPFPPCIPVNRVITPPAVLNKTYDALCEQQSLLVA